MQNNYKNPQQPKGNEKWLQRDTKQLSCEKWGSILVWMFWGQDYPSSLYLQITFLALYRDPSFVFTLYQLMSKADKPCAARKQVGTMRLVYPSPHLSHFCHWTFIIYRWHGKLQLPPSKQILTYAKANAVKLSGDILKIDWFQFLHRQLFMKYDGQFWRCYSWCLPLACDIIRLFFSLGLMAGTPPLCLGVKLRVGQ